MIIVNKGEPNLLQANLLKQKTVRRIKKALER
jgi:hypothetical protein